MDFDLNTARLDYYRKLCTQSVRNEYTADAVVPDTQEDISRILCANAVVLLHSKDISQGKVTLTGDVAVTVMYVPESENGVAALDIKIPFSADFETGEAGEICPVAAVSILALDVRMLNPRKVLARAEVESCVACYVRDEMKWCTDLAQPQREIRIRQGACTVETPALVTEKTFTVAEELIMPAGKPAPEKMLSASAEIRMTENQQVGGKLIVKGVVAVNAFYVSESGQPASAVFETPFSQLMELGEENMSGFDVTALVTDLYVDAFTASTGERALNMELHAVAQAVCRRKSQLGYISDAYSTIAELKTEMAELDAVTDTVTTPLHAVAREQFEMPQTVQTIVGAVCSMGKPEVESGQISMPLCVDAVYLADDGLMYSQRMKLTACADCPDSVDQLTAFAGQIQAIPAGNSIDLRVPVDFAVCESSRHKINAVCNMGMDEEARPVRRPSVTVVRACGEDMWEIAKKYHSDKGLIHSCNGLEEGAEICGRILLIPKC